MDRGPGHLVVCARTVYRRWLAESQRVVQVDNGRSLLWCRCRPCFFWWRREDKEWTGLLPAEDGIKDRTVMYTWGLGTRLRVVGWACAPREAGPALGMRVAAQNLLRVSFRGFERGVERE